MNIIFSDESFPDEVTKSMFLEGPSPRGNKYPDWKRDAENILRALKFDGTVFIPVPRYKFYNGSHDAQGWTYDEQVEWEIKGRLRADVIVCYLDRKIDAADKDLGMPGLTTNIEFGEDLASGKLIYGRPDCADRIRYTDQRAQMLGLPIHNSLEATLKAAVDQLGVGAKRVGGETAVPLFIWNSEQFQSWYSNVKAAGNRLDDAKVLYHARFHSGPVFLYVLWVNIWVAAEQRHKSNEFVVNRKDISAVVAHYTDPVTAEVSIALVKEFRSTVNNGTSYVVELPAGSCAKPGQDERSTAMHELEEEVGLCIEDLTRFRFVGRRQLVASMSAHRAVVYAIALTESEFSKLVDDASSAKVFGEEGTSEKTYILVSKFSDLLTHQLDYSTLGMIYESVGS